MNTTLRATARVITLAATSVSCLLAGVASGPAAAGTEKAEFANVIEPELGSAEFAPGDGIVLKSIRGNRQHFEAGGTYVLEGTYTLASAESADLAWYSTSRGPSGSTPVTEDQHVKVSKGSGSFKLKKMLTDDGWLHVSFYVNGPSHGGIYFGEKGFENTVLRHKGWSDFAKNSTSGSAAREPRAADSSAMDFSAPANLAIMHYLGNPVVAPASLDNKYTPANLTAAFAALGKKAGWQVRKLAVDDSEFPYLVYGVLAGKHELDPKDIRELQGYDYGGSVRGSTDDGSTYFSLNMIPHEQYPSGQFAACNRRLMVRLQMLADSVR